MISCDYIIIGAGFAGASTAYHLTRRGMTDILLLEQEAIPGFHSSGRNAAMIRQCVSDPALTELARDGAAFLSNFPSDWPVPVQFKQNGSLLLGSGEGWEKPMASSTSMRCCLVISRRRLTEAREFATALPLARFSRWVVTDLK